MWRWERCPDEKVCPEKKRGGSRVCYTLAPFTHTHTLAFTPRPLKYTQNPLHTDAVTHRHVLDIFTHEGLYR